MDYDDVISSIIQISKSVNKIYWIMCSEKWTQLRMILSNMHYPCI